MTRISAFAKVNLGLKILNKREDGYHNIETTLTTVSLSDKLLIEKSLEGITVVCSALKIPAEENLCYKAAKLFLSYYNLQEGVKITIQKNIPVGGGLGGGSSDAAGVIKGLAQLFALKPSYEEMINLAKQIGCDVPFFLTGGAAYARGRGDELKFFKLPKMSLIIYYPGYPISTKWAYEEYDRLVLTQTPILGNITPEEKRKKARTGFSLDNDFEKVVFKAHPDLLDVKSNLLNAGAFMVSLSGSGSCLFAVVDEHTKKKVIKYLSGIGAVYFEAETVPASMPNNY